MDSGMEERSRLRRHVRAAREWLGRAEDSLDRAEDVRGDLNLMLAQAELTRAQEVERPRPSVVWARRLAPLCAAALIAGGGKKRRRVQKRRRCGRKRFRCRRCRRQIRFPCGKKVHWNRRFRRRNTGSRRRKRPLSRRSRRFRRSLGRIPEARGCPRRKCSV